MVKREPHIAPARQAGPRQLVEHAIEGCHVAFAISLDAAYIAHEHDAE